MAAVKILTFGRRVGTLVVAGVVFAASVSSAQNQGRPVDRTVPLHAPDEKTIPTGPVGTAIRYGKKVLTETQTYAKPYVGNGLNCTSCHLDGGRRAYASPCPPSCFLEKSKASAKYNGMENVSRCDWAVNGIRRIPGANYTPGRNFADCITGSGQSAGGVERNST